MAGPINHLRGDDPQGRVEYLGSDDRSANDITLSTLEPSQSDDKDMKVIKEHVQAEVVDLEADGEETPERRDSGYDSAEKAEIPAVEAFLCDVSGEQSPCKSPFFFFFFFVGDC